ncbi:MAG TPA: PEP-CTERM sorting domain-containing protein [Bryobacteraceae bacterium]|nr:PEP-CTERM sorting domain-containing protein [Bryobacteraceae bacterium]
MKVQPRLALLALALMLVASASAAPIDITVSGPVFNTAGLETARNAWLAGNPYSILEDFESFVWDQTTGNGYTTLNTATLGTFEVAQSALGSTALFPDGVNGPVGGTGLAELLILTNAQTRFGGRFNTTPGGQNWLDTNDITDFSLTLDYVTNTLFFFITDVEDVGDPGLIRFAVTAGQDNEDTVFSNIVLANGASFFVGIRADNPITSVRWYTTETEDGFGIDDFGVMNARTEIPEPSTYVLLGSALLGAAFFRSRRRA